jgi:hypothetical protein
MGCGGAGGALPPPACPPHAPPFPIRHGRSETGAMRPCRVAPLFRTLPGPCRLPAAARLFFYYTQICTKRHPPFPSPPPRSSAHHRASPRRRAPVRWAG